MEKSGRWLEASRCRRLLTACFAFLAAAAGLFAVDVNMSVSTFELETSKNLHVEITVRDVDPADVALEESGIPPSFALVTGQKDRRIKDGHSVTVVSRDWVPSEPGNFSLGPFLVTARGEKVSLPQIYITVTAPLIPVQSFIRWTVADGRVGTGRPLRITLEGVFDGVAGNFSCPAPENAILESIPASSITGKRFSGTEAHPVQIASWLWTPLSSGTQSLPRARFTYTGRDGAEHLLSSAPCEVSVARELSGTTQKTVSGSVSRAFAESDTQRAARIHAEVASTNSGTISAPAVSPVSGSSSETLATLRHTEYTSLFPRVARIKRLALEAKLELSSSLPVPPAAWKPVCVIGAVLAFSFAFLLRFTGSFFRRLRPVSFSFFFLSVLLAIMAVIVYTRDPGSAGVLKRCDLFHVPEAGSSVVDSLPEGTAVIIGRRTADWVYIRTVTDLDGWVPSDAIIEYTVEKFQ